MSVEFKFAYSGATELPRNTEDLERICSLGAPSLDVDDIVESAARAAERGLGGSLPRPSIGDSGGAVGSSSSNNSSSGSSDGLNKGKGKGKGKGMLRWLRRTSMRSRPHAAARVLCAGEPSNCSKRGSRSNAMIGLRSTEVASSVVATRLTRNLATPVGEAVTGTGIEPIGTLPSL